MIGLLVIQALKHAGCSQVIAVDLDASRLDKARSLGADLVIHSGSEEIVPSVLQHTGGRGADVVMEVVGCQKTVTAAVFSAKRGGHVVFVGNLAPLVEIPLQAVVNRELNLAGSCASNGEYPECIALMEKSAINVSPLISAVASLDEGPAWFDRLYVGEPGIMKVILQP